MVSVSIPFMVTNHNTVKAAAENSGYSLQYVRRLLGCGRLSGLNVGRVWLIDKDAFLENFEKAIQARDR